MCAEPVEQECDRIVVRELVDTAGQRRSVRSLRRFCPLYLQVRRGVKLFELAARDGSSVVPLPEEGTRT